jgi:hypothetical protein
MPINITNCKMSGNAVAISAPSGATVTITCGACGHIETAPGGTFKGDPKCPKCGATDNIGIQIKEGQK